MKLQWAYDLCAYINYLFSLSLSLPDTNGSCQADERMLVSQSIGKTNSSAYQKDFDQNW